jgi:hypothetical protein
MFDTLIEINFSSTQAIDSYTCCSISDTNIDILFIEKLIKRDLIIIVVVEVIDIEGMFYYQYLIILNQIIHTLSMLLNY